MFELTKSHQAEDDLIDIWESTYRTWGEAQAERYLDAIEAAMVNLARNPNIGKAREAIRPGYRSWQVKRHVIFLPNYRRNTLHRARFARPNGSRSSDGKERRTLGELA
jgi:toxin ParE1/3/4